MTGFHDRINQRQHEQRMKAAQAMEQEREQALRADEAAEQLAMLLPEIVRLLQERQVPQVNVYNYVVEFSGGDRGIGSRGEWRIPQNRHETYTHLGTGWILGVHSYDTERGSFESGRTGIMPDGTVFNAMNYQKNGYTNRSTIRPKRPGRLRGTEPAPERYPGPGVIVKDYPGPIWTLDFLESDATIDFLASITFKA